MPSDHVNPQTAADRVDLTNCDREPIHLLGLIQPIGFLIAVSTDWIISFVSGNVGAFLGAEAEEVVGRPVDDLLPAGVIHDLKNKVQFLHGQYGTERALAMRIDDSDRRYDVAVHVSGSNIVFEFEPSDEIGEGADHLGTIRSAIERLQSIESLEQLTRRAARFVQLFTGYDRVMVYRFLPDGAGEVIAETKQPNMESYLGLRYPASDIPQQARTLYLRNPIRFIADVHAEPVAITPELSPNGTPLDLSLSALRSVSLIHLDYLRNMGVRASMSISLVQEGKLWGLIACHHREPKILAASLREAANLFGQMFSLSLENVQRAASIQDEARASELHTRILSAIAERGSRIEQLVQLCPEFLKLISADGIAMCIDGEIELEGQTPSRKETKALLRFLNRAAASEILALDEIGSVFEPGRAFAESAAGLLAIPISRSPRDYLIFFRREIMQYVTWAGDPDKPVKVGQNGARLTPRDSFAAYRQAVRHKCRSWTPSDVRLAQLLRTTLLEVVLQLTDAAEKDRRAALDKQELLISELNHRVRNLLALVQSVIKCTGRGAETTSEFVDVLNHRVRALARAHDQITQQNWSPGSVKSLIRNEGEAFLTDRLDRFDVRGDDVALQPAAISTLALVVHELMTNAAKYGALVEQNGRIAVDLAIDDFGRLVVEWLESDGPPVRSPNRKGFGTTIIERSIPHDLNGEATIEYRLEGLRARFAIPATYVAAEPSPETAKQAADADQRSARGGFEAPRRVLVVEDNILIAMAAEDALKDLGAQDVDLASSVRAALRLIDEAPPNFALLDVNLGTETSFKVADLLSERNIPYAVATGYGERAQFPEAHAGIARLAKPFDKSSIHRVLAAAMGLGG